MLKFCVCLIVMLTAILPAAVVRSQDDNVLGSRFFSVRITRNEKPQAVPGMFTDVDGNFVVKGAPLVDVIARAYGLDPYNHAYGLESRQAVDAPEWVYTSYLYDIEAVPPPAALVASDQIQMLKSMLADRFKLRTELVTRDLPTWVLVADQGDTKLEPAPTNLQPEATRARNPRAMFFRGRVPPKGLVDINMNWLAARVALLIGQPVLNMTELSSLYTIDLSHLHGSDPAALAAQLHEQWGLHLEFRAVPMEHLLVTVIEHPQLDAIDR